MASAALRKAVLRGLSSASLHQCNRCDKSFFPLLLSDLGENFDYHSLSGETTRMSLTTTPVVALTTDHLRSEEMVMCLFLPGRWGEVPLWKPFLADVAR